MNTTREYEKTELYKTIWNTANDLRGSVDGWDFKAYILGTLFYRYISENLTMYQNKEEQIHDPEFDYAKLDDETANSAKDIIVEEKGFYIAPSELFCNVVARADQDVNLNITLTNIFKNITSSAVGTLSENNIDGLFSDMDMNSNKLGADVKSKCDTIRKILKSIASLELGDYQTNDIDVFGDAYEYLMGMYASSAGKSGGEYFTPQEVSELLAKITTRGKETIDKVYDPCCGSGSLLLKFAKILGKENVINGFYGQELNITTYNLCRINMFLHDIDYTKFDIQNGNTLIKPHHLGKKFDAIVSNPPYSIKWAGDENVLNISDARFSPAGVLAPKSKADMAFIMHILHHLRTDGCAAIVEFPGVLYRTGAEAKIRKYLVDNNFVEAIIQLPGDIFFGTSIGTSIIVLKKNKSDNKVKFVDASKLFVREGKKNKLTNENINTIMDAIDSEDVEYLCRSVEISEIVEKEYNLSVSRYVEKEDTREPVIISDLNANLWKLGNEQDVLKREIMMMIRGIDPDSLSGINTETFVDGKPLEEYRADCKCISQTRWSSMWSEVVDDEAEE